MLNNDTSDRSGVDDRDARTSSPSAIGAVGALLLYEDGTIQHAA